MKRIELPLREKGDFEVSCPIEIRFRDIDAMGHVNNAVYGTYFENARVAYMQALDLGLAPDAPLQERFPFVVVDLYCRFLSPATIVDRVRAYIRIADMGRSSFVFEYLLVSENDDREIAGGRTVQACFDYSRQRTMRIPEDFKAAAEKLEGR